MQHYRLKSGNQMPVKIRFASMPLWWNRSRRFDKNTANIDRCVTYTTNRKVCPDFISNVIESDLQTQNSPIWTACLWCYRRVAFDCLRVKELLHCGTVVLLWATSPSLAIHLIGKCVMTLFRTSFIRICKPKISPMWTACLWCYRWVAFDCVCKRTIVETILL